MTIWFILKLLCLVHRVHAEPLVGWRGSDESTAFLIEGGCVEGGCDRFPELERAKLLAKEKQGSVFDPIHSYDDTHLIAFIAGRPGKNAPLTEKERKLFAVHNIVSFALEGSMDKILDKIVKAPYRK